MFNQQLFKRTSKERTCGYCASPPLCGPVLNSGESVNRSEPGLKTLNNNPDAHLTLIFKENELESIRFCIEQKRRTAYADFSG